jgi:DNA polymerase/3'-5' exonuclease PolX
MEYDKALPIAEHVVDLLQPGCKRIEIAGGLRRLKPDPHDIEIVAIPDLRPPRLTFFPVYPTILDAIIASLARGDEDDFLTHLILNGPMMKQFAISQDGGQHWPIKVDLFLVKPPSDWGVLYLIRTGPSDFSHWIVTQKLHGGGLPNGYRVEDGRILSTSNENIPCPEEIDFLKFCGLAWIEPSRRHPMWQRPVRKMAFLEVRAKIN